MIQLKSTLDEEAIENIIKKCQTSSKKWLKEFEVEPAFLQLEFTLPDGQTYQVKAEYKIDTVEIKHIGGTDVTPKTVH